jgi:hypothetical protein
MKHTDRKGKGQNAHLYFMGNETMRVYMLSDFKQKACAA